ncbi:hypothetical protein GCM10023160_04500 [Brachybacterium paraconglomeratum]
MTQLPPETTTDASIAPVVVLVSAPWAGPSRPAPTVLRELGRRWGSRVLTLLVEDPEDEVLQQWEVDVLPTWLRFRHGVPAASQEGTEGLLTVPSLSGQAPTGERLVLNGPWTLTRRRSGALAKHDVESEFGPDSTH